MGPANVKCSRCGAQAPLARGRTTCKPCQAQLAANRKSQYRQDLADYKVAKGCADCGYNAHACALDFDHLPGTVKKFKISDCVAPLDELLAEIAKCEVVCANCHRVRTYERVRVGV